jgi:hypothetical protein
MPSFPAVIACVQLTVVGTATAPDVVQHAVRQAAQIWRAEGVIVGITGDAGSCAIETAVEFVTVVMSAAPQTSTRLNLPRLGEIVFGANGEPHAEIVIASGFLQQEIEKQAWSGQALANRPQTLRHAAAGRAIGRVLAHELGHYLLKTRDHAHRGLMRPVYSLPALLEPKTHKYDLDDADASRLQRLFLDRRVDVASRQNAVWIWTHR